MANLLFLTEHGGGLGHVGRLMPLASGFEDLGHQVRFASRQPTLIRQLGTGLEALDLPRQGGLYQPRDVNLGKDQLGSVVCNLAEVMAQFGWADSKELSALLDHRRHWLVKQEADVVVIDASPETLAAVQGLDLKVVICSNDWGCPPPVYPLPDLSSEIKQAKGEANKVTAQLNRREPEVREALNAWLVAQGQAPLCGFGELFERVDLNVMCGFPELDAYGARENLNYLGVWGGIKGRSYSWEDDEQLHLFAYVKNFPQIEGLIRLLGASEIPTIIYTNHRPVKKWSQHFPNLKVTQEPVDLSSISQGCDLAICHAGRSMTALMLQAGIPLLLIPLTLEQAICAQQAEKTGAAIVADGRDIDSVSQSLQQLLVDMKYEEAAKQFSSRHCAKTPQRALDLAIQQIQNLI